MVWKIHMFVFTRIFCNYMISYMYIKYATAPPILNNSFFVALPYVCILEEARPCYTLFVHPEQTWLLVVHDSALFLLYQFCTIEKLRNVYIYILYCVRVPFGCYNANNGSLEPFPNKHESWDVQRQELGLGSTSSSGKSSSKINDSINLTGRIRESTF